jgi:hypothetical protein
MAPQEGNGMAVAGLVLGIIALVLCWVPFINWLMSLLGIIFGALGIGKANRVGRGKGMAIAGLICAILGAVLGVLLILVFVSAAKDADMRYHSY